MKLLLLQTAVFFNNIVDRPDFEFQLLNQKLSNLFDAIPVTIPVPPNAPLEIPIVQARTSNNRYGCNFSRNRADFYLHVDPVTNEGMQYVSSFLTLSKQFIEHLYIKNTINRLGVVSQHFFESNNAASLIQKKYCNSLIDGSTELTIRYNKPKSMFSFIINDIVEISNNSVIGNNLVLSGATIQRDINNTPVMGFNIPKKECLQLFDYCSNLVLGEEIRRLL